MKLSRQTLIASLLTVSLVGVLAAVRINTTSAQSGSVLLFQELIDQSIKDKKGLTFFVKGQTIGGAVTRKLSPEVVEVRNQTYSRIVIRLEEVDAVAIN